MRLFWLSQNGGDATGPLLLSQLKALAQKGQLTAEDQVCVDGAEDWQPVTTVLGDLPSGAAAPADPLERLRPGRSSQREIWTTDARPTEKEPSNWPLWVLAALLALAAAGGAWYYFFADSQESATTMPITKVLNSKVRKYLQEREPSGDVRVDDIGPPMLWSGGMLRIAHYTVGGGPLTMVMRFDPSTHEVTRTWKPEEWVEQFAKTPDAEHYPGTVRIITDAAKAAAPDS